jgi:adenylate cyclase
VSELDVGRLIAAGVYDPAAPNAADRLALVSHLFDRGVAQDKIEDTYARRGVTGLIEDLQQSADGQTGDLTDRFLSPERLTLEEVAARVGVDVGFVMRTRTAMGFLDPPGAAVIPSTFVDDMAAAVFGVAIFGEDAILRLVRVLGVTAARLAEAAQAMVFSDLAEELLAQPGGELAMLHANEDATNALPLIPEVFVHAFFEHTNNAANTMRGGYRDRIDMATLDLAIAFVDVVSSTEWTASVSREEHTEALVEFERLASESATLNGCRLVKLIGDEAMIVGFDPLAVCRSALALCAALSRDPRLPEARGGVALGAVTPRDGDYFGPPVNLAARCVREAEPGGVVVTAEVAAAVRDQLALTSLGTRDIRGIAEPVELSRIEEAIAEPHP